jgi:hypothetical protein
MRSDTRKALFLGVVLAVAAGCSERDRLTFPTSVDGKGPVVDIFDPSKDTTVQAGPAALITGRVVDQDGIDTVYFDILGGVTQFNPFFADGDDTVTFQLPITTSGQSGNIIQVLISGVNVVGLHGDTTSLVITVQ